MEASTVEKDYESYKQLLDLWAKENPIKTNKLQVLLVVNGLLLSAISGSEGTRGCHLWIPNNNGSNNATSDAGRGEASAYTHTYTYTSIHGACSHRGIGGNNAYDRIRGEAGGNHIPGNVGGSHGGIGSRNGDSHPCGSRRRNASSSPAQKSSW